MRAPRATYRIQLAGDMTFGRAAELVPYLVGLGVSDLYVSPVLQARSGSAHGYDVVDPSRLSADLGGRADFNELSGTLRRAGLGLLVDIVPNHMATGRENAWWMDVLEHGRASRFADFFDIDWTGAGMHGRVLVPILGRQYGDALDAGELRLVLERDGLRVAYFDHRLPIDPADYGRVLADGPTRGVAAQRFRSALSRAARMPHRGRTDRSSITRRARDASRMKADIWAAYTESTAVRRHVDGVMQVWNGEAGRPETFDRLDALLDNQAYVLAFWRTAIHEVDYRRFFDIAELVSVRTHVPSVFDATHRLVLDLVRRGRVQGLRVDHVDGLADPRGYAERLRARAPDTYVVTEKVLGEDERLPASWPVQGTTGYDFLRDVAGVLIDADGARALSDAFRKRGGAEVPFREMAVEVKRALIGQLFDSETASLTHRLHDLARTDRHARDLTEVQLREALEALTASLDVYRTYVRNLEPSPADRARIERAAAVAARRVSPDGRAGLAFLRRVLLLDDADSLPARRANARLDFAMRWQQYTGPVMAKAVEDTALYRDTSVLALNDVGLDPAQPAVTLNAFHRRNRIRRRDHPAALLTTATHDTKRGEDTRARLAVLTEMADEWIGILDRWRAANARRRRRVGDHEAPDVAEEWLIYETLVAIWPPDGSDAADVPSRLALYLEKAMREAKVHTSWLDPDVRHERAVQAFSRSLLQRGSPFRQDLDRVAAHVAWFGALNSLTQLVLKCTSPGVPDIYQGGELWDLSLVDPDNRHPPDFQRREQTLADIRDALGAGETADVAAELLRSWADGNIKLLVLHQVLQLRVRVPDVFERGSYRRLSVTGAKAPHVVAFVRRAGRRAVVVIVARWPTRLANHGRAPVGRDVWGETEVAVGRAAAMAWRDALTGVELTAKEGRLRIGDVLSILPVAVLETGSPT